MPDKTHCDDRCICNDAHHKTDNKKLSCKGKYEGGN